jgi:hypothetical protein
VWVGCGDGTNNIGATNGTKLYVSDDLQTFTANIGSNVSRAVWSGKMWVFSLVDINGNWNVYYTYDPTARAQWVINITRPTGGKQLNPHTLMYNGMYFIIAGSVGTTVYFCTSIDASVWSNWVTAPMAGGTSFAIATKNVLPSINTIATSIGPTGLSGTPTFGTYLTVTYTTDCSFSLLTNQVSNPFSLNIPTTTGPEYFKNLFTTYINPTSTSTYLVTLNFTYTSAINTAPIVFTICRYKTGTTNTYGETVTVNIANNVNIGIQRLSFTNNNFLAIDNATSATSTTISISVVDTVRDNTSFIYRLWVHTASGFGTNRVFTTSNHFISVTQLTL